MKKLQFAIIGSGNVVNEHISAIQNTENAELVAICSRNELVIKNIAEKHGLLWTTNFNEILENPLIDVIDIVLPSGLHAEFGIKAARAGKHVIVEKPIDVSLEKANALINECNMQAVQLNVISQMRYSDGFKSLREIIRSGKLGKLLQGDAFIKWYRSQEYYNSCEWRGTYSLDGGGVFINQGIHFIDLLLILMGDVKSVFAKTLTMNHNIEVEDNGIALVEFSNGALGTIQASTALFPGFSARLEIHGTKGSIIFENDQIVFEHFKDSEPISAKATKQGGAASPTQLNSKLFKRQFHEIVTSIQQNKHTEFGNEEALKVLQLVLEIYESSKSGKVSRLI